MNNIWNKTFSLILILLLEVNGYAATLQVGNGYQYSSLMHAISFTNPGDTVLVHKGTYTGGLEINNIQGTSSSWIYIFSAPGDTVIYNGNTSAWQMTDVAYIYMKGIIFQQQTSNGINLDDGGSYSSPSHHIILESCTFRNINATGNNDLLKMSGIDEFEIRNCIFLNGSPGGSGIDMVGCHNGLVTGCIFENQGSNSIQIKGGSRNICIDKNFFKNGGQRALNLGGSTGLPYFRPINAAFEAADLKVYANIFIGSETPIAYTGCINSEVINNTFYLPTRWVIRILQETVDTARFAPCGFNTFRNNIIYRDNQLRTECSIGPNTNPKSFTFSNNLWFHSQLTNWNGPYLPVQDVNKVVGQNPLFINIASENFNIQEDSPAVAKGYPVIQPMQDYSGSKFGTLRSIGAFEVIKKRTE